MEVDTRLDANVSVVYSIPYKIWSPLEWTRVNGLILSHRLRETLFLINSFFLWIVREVLL